MGYTWENITTLWGALEIGQHDKNSYEGMSYRTIHDGQLTKNLDFRTRVIHGRLLSQFLYILAIDWIMKQKLKEKEIKSSGIF